MSELEEELKKKVGGLKEYLEKDREVKALTLLLSEATKTNQKLTESHNRLIEAIASLYKHRESENPILQKILSILQDEARKNDVIRVQQMRVLGKEERVLDQISAYLAKWS